MQLSKVSIAALAMFIGLTVAAPLTGGEVVLLFLIYGV